MSLTRHRTAQTLFVTLFLAFPLACGGRAELPNHGAGGSPSAGGAPSPGPSGCPAGELSTQWISSGSFGDQNRPWLAPDGLVAADGDAFYGWNWTPNVALDASSGQSQHHLDVWRVDPGGTTESQGTVLVDVYPRRLIPNGGVPWLAAWGHVAQGDRLRVLPVSGGSPIEFDVHVDATVRDVSAFESHGIFVLADSNRYAIYRLDGHPLKALTPLAIEPSLDSAGWARLHPRSNGRPMVSRLAKGRLYAGDADGPLHEISEPACSVASYDILPLEPGTFVWAQTCSDKTVVIQARSIYSPPNRVDLSFPSRVAAIALGGGPNGTLVAAITTNEELPRLRFLDRTSLSELSSSPLRGCEHPNCDARELAITSIDGVVAVRGEFDIPDGRASHWALVRACGD